MTKFLIVIMGLIITSNTYGGSKTQRLHIKGHRAVLNYSEFRKLSAKSQKIYLSKIQKAFFDYENLLSRYYPVVENKIRIPIFFDSAYAWSGEKCVICGIETNTVQRKCPTRVSPCKSDGITDGFKAGKIFGEVCVSRTPISSLSQRCFDKAHELGVKPAKDALEAASLLSKNICKGANAKSDGCRILTLQLTRATEEASGRESPTLEPEEIATDNTCLENADIARCTPGAITIAMTNKGHNIAQCLRENANEPHKYLDYANTQEFLQFLKQNKSDPSVVKVLAPVDEAIGDLEETIEDKPYFEFSEILENKKEDAKELFVLYNKKAGLCDKIAENKKALTREAGRASARKAITLEELRTNTNWNDDNKDKFVIGCKDKKVPNVKAAQIFYMSGNPPTKKVIETGFPIKVVDGSGHFAGYQIYTFLRGTTTIEIGLKKEPSGAIKAKLVEGETVKLEQTVEIANVHREDVNVVRIPADATDNSVCDSFRQTTGSGGSKASGGNQ